VTASMSPAGQLLSVATVSASDQNCYDLDREGSFEIYRPDDRAALAPRASWRSSASTTVVSLFQYPWDFHQ
jgi:hypothetical protein